MSRLADYFVVVGYDHENKRECFWMISPFARCSFYSMRHWRCSRHLFPLVSVALHRSFDDLTGRLLCRQQIWIEYSELAVCVVSTRFPLKPVPFFFLFSFSPPKTPDSCVLCTAGSTVVISLLAPQVCRREFWWLVNLSAQLCVHLQGCSSVSSARSFLCWRSWTSYCMLMMESDHFINPCSYSESETGFLHGDKVSVREISMYT